MAGTDSLRALSVQYDGQLTRAGFAELQAWANTHKEARAASLLDAAAVGFAFDVVFSEPAIDTSKVTARMRQAWESAYPEIPIGSLQERTLESVLEEIRDWKVKLFEIEVKNRLNDGQWVGDLHLKPGQHAERSIATSQSDWNLKITDNEGIAGNKNQLKAMELLHAFHRALEPFSGVLMFTADESTPLQNSGRNIIEGSALPEHTQESFTEAPIEAETGLIAALSAIAITATARVLFEDTPESHPSRAATTTKAKVHAASFSDAFATFFARSTLAPEPEPGSIHESASYSPSLTRLRTSASRLNELVRTFEPLYPCPERDLRPKLRSYINDYDELLLLVDPSTRLAIQRGSTPLDQWITSVVERDPFTMNEAVLRHHLSDLLQIKADNLVDKAFCGDGYLVRWESAMTGGRIHLEEKLEDAIEIGNLVLKKYSQTFSEADARKIQHLKTTVWDRAELKSQEQIEKVYKECG